MKAKQIIKRARRITEPFRVDKGKGFRLKDVDPRDTLGYGGEAKPRAKAALALGLKTLAQLQDRLYAHNQWALLLIFQAMDAAGKDGAIKHVMSGANPQGCQVFSFKAPSPEELAHDYLWRYLKALPSRGHIGIFNRSYYEEVLVVRVHPELLGRQQTPPELVTKRIWKDRFEAIRTFERYLVRNGVVICKFFLHISKKEQKRRFLERIDNPDKNWKFSANDAAEREHWDDYMGAFEEMIRHTSTPEAPWYVVPADNKWFTRVVVAATVIQTLASLGLKYPEVGRAKLKESRGGQSGVGEMISQMNLFGTRANRKTVEKLRKLDVFHDLTFKEALEVDELLHERVYEKGEIVFEEGDPGHGIFIVVSGKVRADPSQEALKTALLEFGPGEMLGELSLFEEAPRTVTVVAIERTLMVALFRAEFFSLLTKNTNIGVKVLLKLSSTMGRRARRFLLRERHHPSL